MAYEMEIKEEGLRALRGFPEDLRRQIGHALHRLQEDFSGDVKKLKGARKDIYK